MQYRITVKTHELRYTNYVIDADNELHAQEEYERLERNGELPDGKEWEGEIIEEYISLVEKV